MMKEYRSIYAISGSLLLVKNVEGVTCDEQGELILPGGQIKACRVLEADRDRVLVQLFGSSAGMNLAGSKIRFLGRSQKLAVSQDLLGRVFDGMGRPIDGGPPILPEQYADIKGLPTNPMARERDPALIQTGISVIDGLNPLVCGGKLAIFSAPGLPHLRLAAQIACQARLPGEKADFAVVFAAIGLSFEESESFLQVFKHSGPIDRIVSFLSLPESAAAEHIASPRLALTAAEYLAFERDMQVLVILADVSAYADALREVSAARGERPGRRGYPGYLYTDFASLFERAGKRKGKAGSITLLPILTLPEDDKSHPVPDLAAAVTDGQLVLSRELHRRGIFPPVDPLASLPPRNDKGRGAGQACGEHGDVCNQLSAAYARGKEANELAAILGKGALPDAAACFAKFASEFEQRYLSQGREENRSIEESLSIGRELLSSLPKSE